MALTQFLPMDSYYHGILAATELSLYTNAPGVGTGAQCYNNITENYYLVYLQVGSKWSVYLLCDTDLFQQKGHFFTAVTLQATLVYVGHQCTFYINSTHGVLLMKSQ